MIDIIDSMAIKGIEAIQNPKETGEAIVNKINEGLKKTLSIDLKKIGARISEILSKAWQSFRTSIISVSGTAGKAINTTELAKYARGISLSKVLKGVGSAAVILDGVEVPYNIQKSIDNGEDPAREALVQTSGVVIGTCIGSIVGASSALSGVGLVVAIPLGILAGTVTKELGEMIGGVVYDFSKWMSEDEVSYAVLLRGRI